jgi:hypothetical protein
MVVRAPIVPIAISGTEATTPRARWFIRRGGDDAASGRRHGSETARQA